MTLDVHLYTNTGGRDHNEDSAQFRVEGGSGIFAVADGLGGHQYGDVASDCVIRTLLEGWEPTAGEDRPDWLRTRIGRANEAILELQQEKRATMKSTAAALAIDRDRAVWANVGDSRLYFLHDRAIRSVTEDHSVAYKKYRAGEITRAQIGRDEDQSRLLRALGSAERSQPDLGEAPEPLAPGDAFLLCTDGVWEYLYDEEILVDLLKADSAREWAELLLLRVISRVEPGNDNLTLLTVLVQDGPEGGDAL